MSKYLVLAAALVVLAVACNKKETTEHAAPAESSMEAAPADSTMEAAPAEAPAEEAAPAEAPAEETH